MKGKGIQQAAGTDQIEGQVQFAVPLQSIQLQACIGDLIADHTNDPDCVSDGHHDFGCAWYGQDDVGTRKHAPHDGCHAQASRRHPVIRSAPHADSCQLAASAAPHAACGRASSMRQSDRCLVDNHDPGRGTVRPCGAETSLSSFPLVSGARK